jgi:hypothetical protein
MPELVPTFSGPANIIWNIIFDNDLLGLRLQSLLLNATRFYQIEYDSDGDEIPDLIPNL